MYSFHLQQSIISLQRLYWSITIVLLTNSYMGQTQVSVPSVGKNKGRMTQVGVVGMYSTATATTVSKTKT